MLKAAYEEEMGVIYQGNALDVLRQLPDCSVNCCVTSPPYWGLRDYGTARWEGGAADCDHKGRSQTSGASTLGEWKNGGGQRYKEDTGGMPFRDVCGKCGAMRVDEQLGLERTPDEYVAKMVEVFREVRRILRDDGTLWLNIGDSYATGAGKVGEHPGGGEQGARWKGEHDMSKGRGTPTRADGSGGHSYIGPMTQPNRLPQDGLKPKDLVMMPARIALALQADGWYLRQDIVWAKKNPMPESVTDRCTKSHEYIFLLSKNERYYFNQEAIAEKCSENTNPRRASSYKTPDGWDTTKGNGGHGSFHKDGREDGYTGYQHNRHLPGNKTHKGTTAYENGDERQRTKAGLVEYAQRVRKLAEPSSGTKNNTSFDEAMAVMPETRNKRDVWFVGTEPFPEAHFATFPTELIEPCILAGCPPGGTVLDPFLGSGTTFQVARDLQCRTVGIELNSEYIDIAVRCRLKQQVLNFTATGA